MMPRIFSCICRCLVFPEKYLSIPFMHFSIMLFVYFLLLQRQLYLLQTASPNLGWYFHFLCGHLINRHSKNETCGPWTNHVWASISAQLNEHTGIFPPCKLNSEGWQNGLICIKAHFKSKAPYTYIKSIFPVLSYCLHMYIYVCIWSSMIIQI